MERCMRNCKADRKERRRKLEMSLEVKQEKEGVNMEVNTAVEGFDPELLRVDTKIQERRADAEFSFPGNFIS
jgi:hypothetical protein